MKRKIAVMLGMVMLVTGCSGKNTDWKEPGNPKESSIKEQGENRQEENPEPGESTFPGSYTVPKGWIKLDKYSTEEITFYIEEGQEEEEYPDNISISVGTNKYKAEEHTAFREAILQQLLMQLEGADAQLNGDGTYTKQGYVLYIFTIEEEEAVTKQYYVVKDYGYCLIQVTNFSKSEHVYEAAQSIVDSLVWETEE